MHTRRLLQTVYQHSSGADSNKYWLGPLETNLVVSPHATNLSYWQAGAGVTVSHDVGNDAAKLTRTSSGTTSVNGSLLFTLTGNGRLAVSPSQYVYTGIEVFAPQACRAQLALSFYSDATNWTWVDGTDQVVTLAADEHRVIPVSMIAPSSGTPHVELVVSLLPTTGGATQPSGAILYARNATVMLDQDPLDGVFCGSSVGAVWTGTADASTSTRRVATPKTHFDPGVTTKTMTGGSGTHLYKIADMPTRPHAFSGASVWNRPASSLTPVADSDNMVRHLVGNLASANYNYFYLEGHATSVWSAATYYADASSPTYSVIYNDVNGWGSPHSWWSNVRIPLGATPGNNDDGEMVIYDIERGTVIWFWRAVFNGSNWSAQGGSIAYLSGNGVVSTLPTGDSRNIDNSHNGKNGHILHAAWSEMAAGSIDRVIRVALPNYIGSSSVIWPMTYSDGQSTDPLAIPQGAILRLKSSINIDTMYADVPPMGKILLHQMQNYGLMYTDSAGDLPQILLEDTRLGYDLTRWPFMADSLKLVHLADSGNAGATTYFEVCYPAQ